MTLYAGWIGSSFTITLMSEGSVYDTIDYAAGAVSLPTPKAKAANRIFDGWYHDAACTRPVDAAAPGIEGDVTLYAGYRYPTHSNFIDNGDGTFGVGNGRAVAVLGETEYEKTRIDMLYSFTKKSGGAGGLAFRMELTADNSYEAGCRYLCVGIGPDAGVLQVAKVDNGFKQLTGSQVKLANLPQTWQDKFNAASDGSVIQVKMTVLDHGNYFEVYLDDALAYTSTDDLSTFAGKGYGVRSSTKNVTFSLSAQEIVREVQI